MSKRILIVVGHPKPGSFCHALAKVYAEGAVSAGAEVRVLELDRLRFDPILRGGFEGAQPLEEDLAAAQEAILWAGHLAFVYPVWWGTMPALLKGFIDRVFLPGFAFKYRSGSPLWDRLLTGRTAELIVTMDSPPWYYRWLAGQPGHRMMKKSVLEFCGIRPVGVTSIGGVRQSTPNRRQAWLAKARQLGKAA
ncbi:MAG TPA: NAD(P)H-dependent oxidoreductase [Thermoanaerobaculia bacterium]|nr:NAD(P)H-dependent oxidoreductase [Thermoanaerobaculia bacterium]